GYEHDFITLPDGQRADDVACFFTGLHGDDAFAAARLPPIIIERCAFADSIFTGNQQHGVCIHDGDGHDVVALFRTYSPDADRIPTLVAQLFLVKPQTHSVFGY